MAGRRSRASVIDRAARLSWLGRLVPPRTDGPGPGHVFVLAGEIRPLADARLISRQLDGALPWIRVVVVPPRRPIDWSAVACVDASTVDGCGWLELPSLPRPDGFDEPVFEAQLLLGELLAQLHSDGLRAEGWVSTRRGVSATVPAAVRDLPACRAVTVLDRRRRPTLALLVDRLVVHGAIARHTSGRRGPRAVVRTIRTTSAPDPGHRVR